VTTLRWGLSYHKSVCLLSVARLSSVRASYSGVDAYFIAVVYFDHPMTSVQNFTEIPQGNSSVGGVKRKRGSKILKIERWWTY